MMKSRLLSRKIARQEGITTLALVIALLSWGAVGKAQTSPSSTSPEETITTDDAVSLNFEGADIREVIHSLATALSITYTIDPRVQGQVTIRTSSTIPRQDLLPLFHQILRSNGIAAVKVGKVYQIAPVGEAKTHAEFPETKDARHALTVEDHFVIELVEVKHLAAEEMVKVLQPFVTPGGDVFAYPRANLVILTDVSSRVQRLKDLVQAFDTDTFRDLHTQVYRIEYANVEDLGEELSAVLEPYGVISQEAGGSGAYIIPLARTNAIVVVGFDPTLFPEIEKWLQILDVPPEKGGGRTVHVYAVENAKATDLATILGNLYSGGGERGSRPPGPRGESHTSREPSGRSRSGAREGSIGGGSGRGNQNRGHSGFGAAGEASGGIQTIVLTQQEGEKPIFKEDVRIVADEVTNSLVILATARDYIMIRAVLHRLDVVPRQVLIEAMIAEVSLTGNLRFGVEYAVSNGGLGNLLGNSNDETSNTSGGAGVTGKGDLFIDDNTLLGAAKRAVNTGGQGLLAFLTDRDRFLVVINALAAQSRVNILATPHVIAADNQEAHILIGEEVPILSTTSTSTLTSDARTVNSIQYRDTGKILTILPQINSAGLIRMKIRQEVSAVSEERVEGIDSPIFISREAETTVVVQNGDSIIIGGIIDEQKNLTRSGVPFLMDIPVLGRLFRSESKKSERTELLLLITPHIMRDRQEALFVTRTFENRISNLKQMLERAQHQPQPISRSDEERERVGASHESPP